jgi:hypothetical protein
MSIGTLLQAASPPELVVSEPPPHNATRAIRDINAVGNRSQMPNHRPEAETYDAPGALEDPELRRI